MVELAKTLAVPSGASSSNGELSADDMGTMAALPFKIGRRCDGKTARLFFTRSSPARSRRRRCWTPTLTSPPLNTGKSRLAPGMRSRTGDVKVEVRMVCSTEIPEARDDTHGRLPGPDACLPAPRRPAAGIDRHLSFLLLIPRYAPAGRQGPAFSFRPPCPA